MGKDKKFVTVKASKTTQASSIDSRLFSKDYIGVGTKPIEQFILSILNGSKTLLTDIDYSLADDIPTSGGTPTTPPDDSNIPPTISIPPTKPSPVPGIGQEDDKVLPQQLAAGQETFDKLTDQEVTRVKNYYLSSVDYLNIFSNFIKTYQTIAKSKEYFDLFQVTYDDNGDPKLKFSLEISDKLLPLVTQNDGTIGNSIRVEKIQ